ncbi:MULTISPECIES: Gfo/Idh/MocA family protein [Kordiimonas]|uniref:Gfo/Idh/MocA family protein n=1 Tax=Kordiimonas TaxID=288021 RepID=UPI0025803A86|nr:Gfo/Idh/MocA family oxidoreductase [Kordiimonas sp. UBA4487]
MLERVKKILRFISLYGIGRTLFKVAGHMRWNMPLVWKRGTSDVVIIGCGQYGFATIGYYLTRAFGRRVSHCYDIDKAKSTSLARMLGVPNVVTSPNEAFLDRKVKYVYIASNHASHTDYAITALSHGKMVYVEKPVAVSFQQLVAINEAASSKQDKIFVGYNRPWSKAIQCLKARMHPYSGAISLNCFVSGHKIDKDHWYRNPEEGTRICGNAGHWIDLFVHMVSWRGEFPNCVELNLVSASAAEPDDNFILSITTDIGDIFSLMLTARTEPFEGINETVNIQWGDVIAKIDDFRQMQVWHGAQKSKHRYWPKDVGHRLSILQPFNSEHCRNWSEVLISTILVLHTTELVCSGKSSMSVDLAHEVAKINSGIK